MASKQRTRAPRKERTPNQLADLGLFNIPDIDAMGNSDEESEVDESTLESELEALLSGKAPAKSARPKKKVAPAVDIEILAAECLKDPDEEDDDDDSNLLMDQDLLSELHSIAVEGESPDVEPETSLQSSKEELPETSPSQSTVGSIVTTLEERLKLYNEAIKVAKQLGDNSKVRRYGRAIKAIEGLLKSAKSGNIIHEEDIPPIVSIPKSNASAAPKLPPKSVADVPESSAADSPKQGAEDISTETHVPQKTPGMPDSLNLEAMSISNSLNMRKEQYKVAALKAKRAGDKDTALKFIKMSKTFDAVIEAVKNGHPVDWASLPPPPPGFSEPTSVISSTSHQKRVHDETQTSSMEAAALSAAAEPEDPEMFAAPPPPTSVLEALQQRLEKYSCTKQAAEAEGNNAKVRRLQRIVKLYETAIKDYRAGKSIDFEALPTPPGFAPIPVENDSSKPASVSPKAEKEKPNISQPKASGSGEKSMEKNVPIDAPPQRKPKVQRTNTSTVLDKQLEFLLERQKMFRQAALAAKKNGDIQQAKEYLRMSKGFDSMIEATKCGLPIDASTIPTPPQLESDFVIVEVSECIENTDENQEELFENLKTDLLHQIEVCSRNKEHFLRLGDVSSASKFERLGLESRKDLSVIQHLHKNGGSVPRFHYETRLFSMVQCHTDLGDNDLEVTVERGINLPGKPDDLDSYVKLELPIPSEVPQHAKTHTIRDTNNPIFQEEFKFEINRKSRSQLRQFKRQALKLEVWSKGGFLRSDTLLGTVLVKLVDLESKCTIHDSFNLMDGRKTIGGKLEVKVRIRDPLLVKQVEEVKEKWLVIGS